MARRNRQSGSKNPRMEQAGASENCLRHWEILMISKYKMAELSRNDHHGICHRSPGNRRSRYSLEQQDRSSAKTGQEKLQVAIRMQRAGCKMSEQPHCSCNYRTCYTTPRKQKWWRGGVRGRGIRVQLHYAQNNRMYSCTTSPCPSVAISVKFCKQHKL